MQSFTERARAKINLTLRVRGRRPDGYHELESLVVFADFGDTVTLTLSGQHGVVMDGPFAREIAGANILDRCLDVVRRQSPALRLGGVRLEKHLPVAAGIGGGSADAAALLRAIKRANPDSEGPIDWPALAKQLGADVAICLWNNAALMSGIGESIFPITGLPKLHALLVNPRVPVPVDKTAQVFRRLAAPALAEERGPAGRSLTFVDRSQLMAYLSASDNDLALPARAVVPAISDVERALQATAGCLLVRLSGAGPTCFAVYDTTEEAATAADTLTRTHRGWWVRRTELG